MPSAEAGHKTRVNYYWEDNGFASAPNDVTEKVPGADAQLTTAEGRNTLQQVFRPGSRVPVDTLALMFDGTFALQFTLTNAYFMRGFLGEPSTTDNTGTSGEAVHAYTGTDTTSLQIVESYEEALAERYLMGCVPTRLTVEVAVGDVVRVTVEGMYAEEKVDTDISGLSVLKAQTTTSNDELTFVDAGLSLGGTTEGYVQDMTFTLESDADLIREMGSRFAIDYIARSLVPSVDFRSIRHGDTGNIEDMYGSSFNTGENTQSERMENKISLDMDFDNGKANGSGVNKLELDIGGSLSETYGEQGIGDPRADLEQTVNRFAETVTASYTNETASAP